MGRHQTIKGALRWSALFSLRHLLVCALGLLWTSLAPACPADHIDEVARVAVVYDGDTVQLEDGRKVRLAGINTPELAHQGKPAEPLAAEARLAVMELLAKQGPQVKLRYEQERYDRYGRLLAHLFLSDDSSIERYLLAEGLALQLVVPPNDWQSGCYRLIERQARQQHRGIWQVEYYRPLESTPAKDDEGSYRLVSGTVQRVAESRKSVWLTLDNGIALRIARRDLMHFEAVELKALQGQRVVARGWLRHDGRQWLVNLRDSTALMMEHEWK